MFVRKIAVRRVDPEGKIIPCPLAWIDNFAMRNFTNDQVFDDTLPVSDGLIEIGTRVPLTLLAERLEDWCRRKSYLKPEEKLKLTEL